MSQNIITTANHLIRAAHENNLFEVASKILQKEGDTPEEAKNRLETFFQSLAISVSKPGKYAFHEYEDKAFHACLLDNEAFDEVCKKVLGHKVGHMSWARLGDSLAQHQPKADKMAIDHKNIFGDSKMLSEGTNVICWDKIRFAS